MSPFVLMAVVQLSVSAPFNTPFELAYPASLPQPTSRAYPLSGLGWAGETSSARMATVGHKPWGARLQFGVEGLLFDASWLMSHRWDATIRATQDINEFRLGPQGYTSVPLSQDAQENRHQVDLHTFSLGLQYNIWEHVTKYVAISPGIGVQRTLARNRVTVSHTRTVGQQVSTLEDTSRAQWTNGNQQSTYFSVDTDVYPYGRKGHVGLGYTLRYVPKPQTIPIYGATMLEPYSIPIKERRWSMVAHINLIF